MPCYRKPAHEHLISAAEEIISMCQPEVFGSSARLLSLAIIGSSVNPQTLRRTSDMDLVAIINDEHISESDTFKFSFIGNNICNASYQELCGMPIDIKFYTPQSFEKELLHGTNTALFAFLHAYDLILDTDHIGFDIVRSAHMRMQATIDMTKDQLRDLDLEAELNNLVVYFTEAYNILTSEKIASQSTLLLLTLGEYLKAFCVQFLRISYAKDIQSGIFQDNVFNDHIRHLIVLSRWDGTRLMNYKKYLFDPRLLPAVESFDSIIFNTLSIDQKIKAIFGRADALFKQHFDRSLIRQREEAFEFKRFMPVGGI